MSKVVLGEIIERKIKDHPLYTKDKKIVVGRGNPKGPEFLIFGEAPGKTEDLLGEPFIGRAGGLLNMWLKESSVNSFYISNVVPLIPLEGRNKIRRPTKEEILDFCFFVRNIIDKVKPRYVITLGDSAAWALTKEITRNIKGKVVQSFGLPLTGIFHPARYIRLGKEKSIGLNDFKMAVKLLRNRND